MVSSDDYNLTPPPYNDQQTYHNMNLSMLYYSFFVVATAGVLLAIYHCLVVNWCSNSSWPGTRDSENATVLVQSSESKKVIELESSTFEYRKGQEDSGVTECVVCLSAYEDGENVRQLLRCNHCFHAPCIDMWLYSHFECPLCRAPVGDIKMIVRQTENTTQGVTDPTDIV